MSGPFSLFYWPVKGYATNRVAVPDLSSVCNGFVSVLRPAHQHAGFIGIVHGGL